MKDLPLNVTAYKKTKIFCEESIPEALLQNHKTQKDVWGKINILEGELMYTIDSTPPQEIKLTSKNFGVVEPEVPHKVSPINKVRFYVEFYK